MSRDLVLNQKTEIWYIITPIRAETETKKGGALLHGIIEADKTYIDGKLRNLDKREDFEPSKRGHSTEKDAIIRAVQQGGKVVAQLAPNLTGRSILEFIKRAVEIEDVEIMTDEFQAYHAIGREMKHHVVNHHEQFVDGDKHTNIIEGFWSLLKRAWYGNSHHHYQRGYTPLIVAEQCYTHNYRNPGCIFTKFVGEAVL